MAGPSPVDSPEAARAAVRAWAAKPDRMKRLDDLWTLIARCRTEQQLRYVAEAMVATLRNVSSYTPAQLGIRAPEGASAQDTAPEPEFVEMEVEPASQEPEVEEVEAPPPAPPSAPQRIAPAAAGIRPSLIAPPSSAPPPVAPRPAESRPLFVPPPAVVKKVEPFSPPVEPKPPEDAKEEPTFAEVRETPRTPMLVMPPPPPLPLAPETLPVIDPKTLPSGVDAEILADVMRVEQCRGIFASSHQDIEVWEVFCLVMMEGDRTRVELERILALRAVGDMNGFDEGAEALFNKLLELRAKFGKFIQDVRAYVATLQVGHFGKETMEMSLGFLVVSARGRDAATRWLAEPKRSQPEASGRWEGLISKTMSYQTAAQQVAKK